MKKKNDMNNTNDETVVKEEGLKVENIDVNQNKEEVLEQEIKLESGNPSEPEMIDPLVAANELVEKLKKENEHLVEQIKFSQAELVSYRMRKDEETASMLKYANKDLISELIPLVDNFERALKIAEKNNTPEFSKYLEGFQMMYTNLLSVLTKYGVEVIDRTGQVFDPSLEQTMVAESHPEIGDEVILEVLQKGYKLKDRVIRPASVKINQI